MQRANFVIPFHKPFLEAAPWLIACFVQPYSIRPDGRILKHYYAVESVGIAVGMLVTALCHCGLVSLTHTPSPMKFLNDILGRPSHERPFVLKPLLDIVPGWRHPTLGLSARELWRRVARRVEGRVLKRL